MYNQDCNKCTTLVGNVNNEESIFVPSSQLAVKPKTALKIKVFNNNEKWVGMSRCETLRNRSPVAESEV